MNVLWIVLGMYASVVACFVFRTVWEYFRPNKPQELTVMEEFMNYTMFCDLVAPEKKANQK